MELSDLFKKLPYAQRILLVKDLKSLSDIAQLADILCVELNDEYIKSENPGYEILKIWEIKEKSTFRVLKDCFDRMKRTDLVNQLEDFRQGIVKLILIVNIRNKKYDLRRQLDDLKPKANVNIQTVIKQIIGKHFPEEIDNKEVYITMKNDEEPWSKNCSHFAGQEIEIFLTHMNLDNVDKNSKPVSTSVREKKSKAIYLEEQGRSVVTAQGNFNFVTENPSTGSSNLYTTIDDPMIVRRPLIYGDGIDRSTILLSNVDIYTNDTATDNAQNIYPNQDIDLKEDDGDQKKDDIQTRINTLNVQGAQKEEHEETRNGTLNNKS